MLRLRPNILQQLPHRRQLLPRPRPSLPLSRHSQKSQRLRLPRLTHSQTLLPLPRPNRLPLLLLQMRQPLLLLQMRQPLLLRLNHRLMRLPPLPLLSNLQPQLQLLQLVVRRNLPLRQQLSLPLLRWLLLPQPPQRQQQLTMRLLPPKRLLMQHHLPLQLKLLRLLPTRSQLRKWRKRG